MRKPAVLITGAGGEIGHGLIERLAAVRTPIVSLDVNPLEPELARRVTREVTGSILEVDLLERLLAEFAVDRIFHLAALLSTRAEFTPISAHHVNVDGTLNLLEFAQHQGESHGRPVMFLFPSSIAAYGLPSVEVKAKAGKVKEDEWNHPITMYGCNKLYCERLGHYYARHYKQLAVAAEAQSHVDFRAIRFPGLISATTVPSGGTSDYASEMLHAAAGGEPYACFVRPDTQIPFMAMPDAVESLLTLSRIDRDRLTRTAYNAAGFSASAGQIHEIVRQAFPQTEIGFETDAHRQRIVDTWPADVDDTAARQDWGFAPVFDLRRVFDEYLIPTIKEKYEGSSREQRTS